MSIIDELIFDRTNDDLVKGNPKGKYDYVDYNRVGQAINYVANEIGLVGISAKTDWTNLDIPRVSDMNQYRGYIYTIRQALGMSNGWPQTNNAILTITGANQIEKLLYDAYHLSNRMMRWSDVNNLQETWDTLDAKQLSWSEYFIKPDYEGA